MCRLFAFKSECDSDVHHALIRADNALATQSLRHPDGWGLAYYIHGIPHIIKSPKTAMDDSLFQKTSGVVSSQVVLAHLRKATEGKKDILNTHPFQFGAWSFVHNGHIKQFDEKKEELLHHIPKELQRFIQGETDSEVLFFFFLASIAKKHPLEQTQYALDDLTDCLLDALSRLRKIIGKLDISTKMRTDKRGNYLTFILTNGNHLVAYQGGQPLLYSTKGAKTSAKHLLLSSEAYDDQYTWHTMKMGDMIAMDQAMNLQHHHLSLHRKSA